MTALTIVSMVLLGFATPQTSTPVITSVEPSSGLQGSTVRVTISGSNFPTGATIVVSHKDVIVTSAEAVNPSRISALLVLGTPGVVEIAVATPTGTSNSKTFTIGPNALGSAYRLRSTRRWEISEQHLLDGIGLQARFNQPTAVWGDGNNLYVSDTGNASIRKIEIQSRSVTTIAGSGKQRFTDGTGAESEFIRPTAIWGSRGALYIADGTDYHCIRRLELETRAVTTFVGLCEPHSSQGVDGDRTSAAIGQIGQIWGDGEYLYLADTLVGIQRVEIRTGHVVTLALSPASAIPKTSPPPRAIWGDGTRLYVGYGDTVYKLSLSTLVATRLAAFGSGTGASPSVRSIFGNGQNLFVTLDSETDVREIALDTGQVTMAGSDHDRFSSPWGLWAHGENLYISDQGNSVIRWFQTQTGEVATLAGKAHDVSGDFECCYFGPDLGPAIWGNDENLYIAGAFGHSIGAINLATGKMTTVAGSAEFAGAADGVGTAARFSAPSGIWGDTANLYVADTGNHTIRRIKIATGEVTTIAGSPGESGRIDEIGPRARFVQPASLWGDGTNLYIADLSLGSSTIRRLSLSRGDVTTFLAGPGLAECGQDDSTWHALWGDGEYLYFPASGSEPTNCDFGFVRRFDLATGAVSTFKTLLYMVYPYKPYGIWSDGVYLYVSVQFLYQSSEMLKIRLDDGVITAAAGFPAVPALNGVNSRSGFAYGVWGNGKAIYVVTRGDTWGVERLEPAESAPPVLLSITPKEINPGSTILATLSGLDLTSDNKVPAAEVPSIEAADPALRFENPSLRGLSSLSVLISVDANAPSGDRVLYVVTAAGRSNPLTLRINSISAIFPTVPPYGAISVKTISDPAVAPVAAYAKVEPDGYFQRGAAAVVSYRQNGILVSEAAFSPPLPIRDGRIYVESDRSFKTGIAMANPNDHSVVVSFYFTDIAGAPLPDSQTTIPANGQIVAFMDQQPFAGQSPFRGTLTFRSSQDLYVSAIRGHINERSEFLMTPLPVTPLSGRSNESGTQYIPHFADGGGWTTQIVLVNPTSAAIRGKIQFFSQGTPSAGGEPVVMELDGKTGTAFDYIIPANASQRLDTSGATAETRVGSVRIMPDSGSYFPSSLAIFLFKRDGVTVNETGLEGSFSKIDYDFKADWVGDFAAKAPESMRTAIVMTNTGNTPLRPFVASIERVIPPNGQSAFFLDESLAPSSIVSVESTPAVIESLRARYNDRGDLIFTALPNITGPLHRPIVFPLVVNGGGYSTEFIFAECSYGGCGGALKVFSQSGDLLKIPVQ